MEAKNEQSNRNKFRNNKCCVATIENGEPVAIANAEGARTTPLS